MNKAIVVMVYLTFLIEHVYTRAERRNAYDTG